MSAAPFTYGHGSKPIPRIEAAHPRIAGFLASTGEAIADVAQADLDEPLTSWKNELAAGLIAGGMFTALYVAAPWLEALGRWVAP